MPLFVRNNDAPGSSLFCDTARRGSLGRYHGLLVNKDKQTVPSSLRTDVIAPNKFRCLEDINPFKTKRICSI
jgi:hypothetical protein